MMVSVVLSVLYISKDSAFVVLVILKSRNFNLLSVSRSRMKFKFGVMLLKCF